MIVSAIPFAGNKRKLWSQIEPLLPEGEVFVDMFMGGGTMALNATTKYEKVYACDVIEPLMGLHDAYKNDNKFLDKVSKVNDNYPGTKEGYLLLRKDYNIDPTPAKLQNLILRSNTNYMRFNSKGEFNMTYGERNHFNMERMIGHKEAIKSVEVFNTSYYDLVWLNLWEEEDSGNTIVFYADCPYSGTTATYCEQGGWTNEDDDKLLDTLLSLHKRGHKVVASNIFSNRGVENKTWIDFCDTHQDKFTVHHLNRDYNNSSFRKGTGKTDEVLIVSK